MSFMRNQFLKKSLFAVSANMLSMIASIFLSLVLPNFVSVEDYGYWQLFILYSSYVGFLHFGFCDGLYLKYGGYDFSKLDASEIYSLFLLYESVQIIFSLFLILGSHLIVSDPNYRLVCISLGVYLFVANTNVFLSYILLATDQIYIYSRALSTARLLLLFGSIFIILCPVHNKIFSIIQLYILAFFVELFILIKNYIKLFRTSKLIFRIDWNLIRLLTGSGFVLMFSNILATLMIGSGRMIVEQFWNIEIFAKLSLAVSISMFFLTFVSSIGYVIFPMFKKIGLENAGTLIHKADFIIGFVMMIVSFSIIPLTYLIENYLPKYIESVQFIIYLLPTCLYLTKSQVLYTAFYKSINKQSNLLLINLTSFCVVISLYTFFAINHMLSGIALSMLIGAFIRYSLLKFRVDKLINHLNLNYYITEIIFAITYIVLYIYLPVQCFSILLVLFILIYFFINKNTFVSMLRVK